MKTIESYLPIFQGFYGTIFECDDEENFIEEGKTYDDYEWNYKEYNERVAQACCSPIEDQLKDFGISVKYQALYSPKFYNYSNDVINVEYTLKDDSFQKVVNYLKENLTEFEQYLKDHFKSYDGFSSFFNYDTETWFNEYLNLEHDKISTIFGSTLDFILENEGFSALHLHDEVVGEMWIECELKAVA